MVKELIHNTRNWSGSEEACQELCDKINAYWEERGYCAAAKPNVIMKNKKDRKIVWGVRSNMVGGRPTARLTS